MCNPLFAVAAITSVKTIADYADKKQQSRALRGQAFEEHEAANEAIDAAQVQVDKRARAEMSQRARAALLERGRLAAIAADSGVTGNTQERLMRESFFNEGFDIEAIRDNLGAQKDQLERSRRTNDTALARQLLATRPPSLLGAGLSIAGSFASAYAGANSGSAPSVGNELAGTGRTYASAFADGFIPM